ncbi:MAG: sulfite exporter TauE/SafE family protein [Ruminococcaceae bacterium]|nr:sulfite exporter TauE/SafE family protein [Oscillospiraceae bacterium]
MSRNFFHSLPSYFLPLVAIGISAGFINGLLGAGGGIVLVLLLPRLAKRRSIGDCREMENRDWYASALSVMLPATVISGAVYLLRGGMPELSSARWLVLPAAVGGAVGALLLGRIKGSWLRRLFAALVIFSGIRMIF